MGLFSKDEKIPAIPPAPTLPKIPIQNYQEKKDLSGLPELPSFPATPKNENFNREMVKSAVSDMPSPGEEEVNVEVPENFHIVEAPHNGGTIPPSPLTLPTFPESKYEDSSRYSRPIVPEQSKYTKLTPMSLPSQKPFDLTPPPMSKRESSRTPNAKEYTEQREPIFVRIDKFQSAQKNFEQIKEKVSEIESVLKRLKDVKSQEEVELKGWTEDVEKIKSKLSELDEGIFNQI